MSFQNEEQGRPPDSRAPLLSRLRRYLFTGLVIIAPAAITIWATIYFVTFFDAWVKPFIPAAYDPDNYLPFRLHGYGMVIALVGMTLVGALAANLVGRTLLGWWDKLLNRTPVVRSIYKSSKQVFETLFSEKGTSFRMVCLIEWPRRDVWTMAFISRELDGSEIGLEKGRTMYAAYVATTPNPTGGYLFFCDKSEVRVLDMSVEEGLKLVISMGLVFPDKPVSVREEMASGKLSRRTKA